MKLKLISFLIFLAVLTTNLGLTQSNLSGTPITATALSCPLGGSPNASSFIRTFAGYFGSPGSFPKAGDITTVYVNYQILGQPCGTLEGVYTELFLPPGAEIAGEPLCFLNGQNVSSSPEFNCRVFNETSSFGGQVLGTNLLLAGQSFELRIPVKFEQALSNSKLQFCVQSASVDNFLASVSPLCPEKSITVPYNATIGYPNPSAIQITSSSATLRAQVKSNFKAGNAFIDFGSTQTYGSSSQALAIPATGDSFDISVPLQNLNPGSLYHWRVRFVSGAQTFLGANQSFSTSGTATPPSPSSFMLSVAKSGTGSGSLGSLPLGIACNASCSAASSSFPANASVKLYATAAQGSSFVAWTGACSGSSSPCTITMDAAKTVTAIFNTLSSEPQTHSLTITTSGSGSVSSQPLGISCPNQCEAEFNDGVSVKLNATAATGFNFVGWSGACSGSGACILPMTQNRSVGAVFSPVAQESKGTLKIEITGLPEGAQADVTVKGPDLKQAIRTTSLLADLTPGEYSVSSSPIDFEGKTYKTQIATQLVTVTANSQAELNIIYLEELTTPPPSAENFSLQVILEGKGLGKITSIPLGLDCPIDCTSEFAKDTEMSLTAFAQEGSSFAGWTGVCQGFGEICNFTLSKSESITAVFIPLVVETETQLELSTSPLAEPAQLGRLNDVALLSFRAQNTGNESLSLRGLEIKNLSSANAQADLKQVKLYLDRNQNQMLDAQDSLLGSVVSNGDQAMRLNLDEGLELPAEASLNLLLAADFEPSLFAALSFLSLLGLGLGLRSLGQRKLILIILLGLLLAACNFDEPLPSSSKKIQLQITELSVESSANTPVLSFGLPLTSEAIELD